MAKKRKQPAQGGGRAPASEPRLQVFKQFNGCNFELSPREFTLGKDVDEEQSDLMMNFVVVEDNVRVTSNRTMETRSNIRKLCDAREGKRFSDASILIGSQLYMALDDGEGGIDRYSLEEERPQPQRVEIRDVSGGQRNAHHWRSFAHVDGKLVGTAQINDPEDETMGDGELWDGELDDDLIVKDAMTNAAKVPDPQAPTMANVRARGTLKVNPTMTDECCFRVGIAWAHINKYGPTMTSPQLTFYASAPVDEWHGGQFAQIVGNVPTGYGVLAVEIYYNAGNSASLLFAGRTDDIGSDGGWTFDWFGYLDVVSMWPAANLVAPTENLTRGVPASHIACVDSRLYFWGNEHEPQRLWIGGNPGNLFSTAPGTGGGFVDVDPGTGQKVRYVDKYKTQSGNSIVTMLCDSPNSTKEQRYNLVENTVTISNEQNMKSWQAEQVAGAVGCKSEHGARVCQDGLYSVSRYGLALTTMTMEYNSQIRTTYVSDPIKPVFTDKKGELLSSASLLEADGVLYLAFGNPDGEWRDDEKDKMLFCYDINGKAWWTYTLNVDEPIIDLIHIDWQGHREGIGIVTPNSVYLLPTTEEDDPDLNADFDFIIQTGELAPQQPMQGWVHLSQLEFHFDHFIGDMLVELTGIDQFGRMIKTSKRFHHDDAVFNDTEWMRVDLRLQSYQLRMTGQANFRMSHFIAKLYTMSNKVGLVWGFDDSQSYRSGGDVHPTFKDYNDIRKAVHL